MVVQGMTEPEFDVTQYSVTDVPEPEHITPNHHVQVDEPHTLTPPWKRRNSNTKTNPLPKEKKPAPPYREGMFIEPMQEFYEFLGMSLMPFRPKVAAYLLMPEIVFQDGERIEGKTGAVKCAEAWDACAKKSESVRRFLDGFVTISVWGTLITVHMPIVIGFADKGSDKANPFEIFERMMPPQESS